MVTTSDNLLDGLDFDIPVSDSPSAPSKLIKGGFVGPYEIISEVGAGGVARVYRARHIHPHYAEKPLVLKVLHDELAKDTQIVGLFRREAYVLSLIRHNNIVETFEAGNEDGQLFIAMEYVVGRDLDELLWRCQRNKVTIPKPLLLHIVGEILRALAYAHSLCDADGQPLKLVHRDVNPSNVFISFNGAVKLGDFGVAAITMNRSAPSHEVAGKLGYFAPEQLVGGTSDMRSDLYALGATMFEALAGRRLFDAEDDAVALKQNTEAVVPSLREVMPDVSNGVAQVLLKALAKRPQDRFVSADAMLQALGPFLPPPETMALALKSLLRSVFAAEYDQEAQLVTNLTNRAKSSSQPHFIDVVTKDLRGQHAMAALFANSPYHVRIFADIKEWRAQQAEVAASCAIVDLCGETSSPEMLAVQRQTLPAGCSIAVLTTGLEANDLCLAHALGAQDILFKPLHASRVIAAVAGMLRDIQNRRKLQPHDVRRKPYLRALYIGQGPCVLQDTAQEWADVGYGLTCVLSVEQAQALCQRQSHHLILLDVREHNRPDKDFTILWRSQPGISLVPIVFLQQTEKTSLFVALPERTVRLDAREPIIPKITELLQSTNPQLGRLFERYDTEIPVQIRFGGVGFSTVSINISRNGVLVKSQHLPRLEAIASVEFCHLEHGTIIAHGRVVRVAMVETPLGEVAHVGIAFEVFVGDSESRLVGLITQLAECVAVKVPKWRHLLTGKLA